MLVYEDRRIFKIAEQSAGTNNEREVYNTLLCSAEHDFAREIEVQCHARQSAGKDRDHRLACRELPEGHEQEIETSVDREASQIGGEEAAPLNMPGVRSGQSPEGPKPVAEPGTGRGGEIRGKTCHIKSDHVSQGIDRRGVD